MSCIRSKDTKPERILRSALHSLGYRFRLHRKDLPGKPDLALPRYRVAVFVHGCFWHQHEGCIDGKPPKTRENYWKPKFQRTAQRDVKARQALKQAGWKSVVVWECEVENETEDTIKRVVEAFKRRSSRRKMFLRNVMDLAVVESRLPWTHSRTMREEFKSAIELDLA